MAKDFMDTQTGGTSNYESNTSIKPELETKLPSAYAASSIQKANSEPKEASPDLAISQEGKEVEGLQQESAMAPMMQNAPPEGLQVETPQEQPVNIDPNVQGLEEIVKEEGIDLFIDEEDRALPVDTPKVDDNAPQFNQSPTGTQVFLSPSEDNPITIPDVDEESDLMPVNEIGQRIITDIDLKKEEVKAFNEENENKDIKTNIDGGFIFEQDIDSPFNHFDTIESMEGVAPEKGKTPGYYEMPGARRGRYLRDSEGDWFKIYTNSRNGKRIKRKMFGLRASSLEDNSELIAPIDSNFNGLWELDNHQYFKGKRDDSNFVFSQDLAEANVQRYKRFNYSSEDVSLLKSRLSGIKKNRSIDLEDPKNLASMLKPDWEYRYGGKKYMKSNGKWFFISKNGSQNEVKYDVPAIEAYSKPVSSLGGLSSGYVRNRFNASMDFIKDKAQDFENNFSEAVSSGSKSLLDFAAWGASRDGKTVSDIMKQTFEGSKSLGKEGYDGMTSRELMRAQIEVIDHFGVIASSELDKYSKQFSLSPDSWFSDNPYEREGYFKNIQPGLMDKDLSPMSASGDKQELGFNPYKMMSSTLAGRNQLMALGYLSTHNGFQEPKSSGVYSIGNFSATKNSLNEWKDSDGKLITDIKTISSLESAGSSLSKENILNSLKDFSGVSFGGDYVRNKDGKLEFTGGEDVDLSRDTEIGKTLNGNRRLMDFVMSRPYISDSSTAIGRFISQENGGSLSGTTKFMVGANELISIKESADLSQKLSKAVSEYNGFLSSEEKLINFSSRNFSNKTQPFDKDQISMLEETQMEAFRTINSKRSDSDYFSRVDEVYSSAKNTIQNIYNANKKLEEVDASGQTVDGYMFNRKKTVLSTMANTGDSEQIDEAMKLWELNSGMTSLIVSGEQDGKLDISKEGKITFTDRVSEEEKEYINSKLYDYQEKINSFKRSSASQNLNQVSEVKSNLQNIPVARERLLFRLQNLDPESQEYSKTGIALAILDRLEAKNKSKIEGIKITTDAILKTSGENLVQETSDYKWMSQHLASVPTGDKFSAKNKFDFLFESINLRRLELESQLNTTSAGLSYDKVKDLLSITGGLTEKEKEYYQTILTVRSMAPLYANNNYGVETDQGAGEKFFESIVGSYYKFFFPNTYVKGSPLLTDLVQPREYAREISGFMDEAGIPTKDYNNEREAIALEKFGNKEIGIEDTEFWGDQVGNGFAFMSAIFLTMQGLKGGYKGVNALSKLGSGVEATGVVERVVTTANNAYSAIMNSNRLTRAFIHPIQFGATFKVGGLPFNEEVQEKMNFESGLLGGIFAKGLVGTGSYLSTTIGKNQYLQQVFGNKYGQVVKMLVDKSKTLRKTFGGESTATMFGLGMGETTKQVREELTLAWQGSDKGKDVWDVIKENYGTFDKAAQFVVSSVIMGAFFHIGANFGKAKRVYDTLTPEMKAKVDAVKSSIDQTSKDAVEASERVMEQEVERHATSKAIDKVEGSRKSKKDDIKNEEGVSGEEQKGEKPVEETPVEESLYKKQNNTAEVTISDKKLWGEATFIREKIENAGDIFREIAMGGKGASYRYIKEKIDKLQNFKRELNSNPVSKIPSEIKTKEEYNEWQSKTGNYDAVDGFEYIQKFHKDALDTIKKEYEDLRADLKTPEQQLALDAVLNVIDGNMKGLTENLIDLNRLSRKLKEKSIEPEEQTEAKEDVKTKEEDVAPEEIDSERISLRLNEEKSQDKGRDVYDIYDDIGNKVGEVSTGMEANGDVVVEDISINEGSQKKGYAKEAVEALNNSMENNVMVDNINPNTKVVGESLAKQENANVNESGMTELETNKPPVEDTGGMSRSQKAANSVRQLKINFDTNGQTFGSMLPFDQAWNFAVESAAKIIEFGGTASKAYSRAINSYKNSNFYKSLKTKSEKEIEMGRFQEALKQEVGDVGLKDAQEKIQESYDKIEKEAKKGDYYQGLRGKNGKPDSARRKKFIEDLKEDFDAKVSRKISDKLTTKEKKKIDEAREASTKEGRFQSQYETALSDAVESLKVKSSKQIALAAARARIMASDKYQKLKEQDQFNENVKERAMKSEKYKNMEPEKQAEYLERLMEKSKSTTGGAKSDSASKYLEDMTKKAAKSIGTRADYASKFMEEAIVKAEEKYKESEFYKEATPERQEQMLEDFRSNARRIIEEKVEGSMDVDARKEMVENLKSIDPEVVKRSPIERGRGQRTMREAGMSKVEYKVTLKQMIADKAKYAKEGAKYMQTVKDSVAEYARLNMPKGKYSNTELSYVLNQVKKAKTLEDIGGAFEKIDTLIDKKIGKQLDTLRKDTKKKYTGRGLEKQFFKKDKNGNKSFKIKDIKVRKEISDFIKKNVTEGSIENMNLSELQDLNSTISEMIKDGRADSIKKEKIVDAAKRRLQASIIEGAKSSFKAREKGVSDMESLYDHMLGDNAKGNYVIIDGQLYNKTAFSEVIRSVQKDFVKTEEYKAIEGKEAQEQAKKDYIIDNPPFDLGSSSVSAYRPFGERTRRSERMDRLSSNRAVAAVKTLGISRAKYLYFDNMDLGGQMNYLARGNKPMLEFIDKFVNEPLKDAIVFYEKEIGDLGDLHESALKDIFGDSVSDMVNKAGKVIYGNVPRAPKRLKERPSDLRKNGEIDGEIIIDPSKAEVKDIQETERGKRNKTATNAQIINSYLLGKSRIKKIDGVETETNKTRQRLIDQEYDIKSVDEYMKRPENSDLMKYADWLENYYNTKAKESFSKIFEDITDGGEFTIENYYPQKADRGLTSESDLFLEGELLGDNVDFNDLLISTEGLRESFVKERTNSGKLSTELGADDVFRSYNRSMTRLKHFNEPAKNMSTLVNNKNISSLMVAQGGKSAFKDMKESFMQVITGKVKNPGTRGNVVGKIQGATTIIALAGKLANLPKQFTSFTHFWKAGIKYGIHSDNAFLAGISPIIGKHIANPFGLVSFFEGSPRYGLAKNTTAKEDATFLTSILKSQFIKQRYRGGAEQLLIDVARMQEEGDIFGTNLKNSRKNVSNTVMLATRLGDMAGVLLGPGGGMSFATNLFRKYRGDGLSVEAATEKAYRNFVIEAKSTQQTSEMYYRSKFQQGELSKYIGMFKTSQGLAAKKVLNSIELVRSGKDLSKMEKASAISDMIHYSIFASLGFTATATGAIWLLTGDTPFELGGGDPESEKRVEENIEKLYGPDGLKDIEGEVRKRMVYTAAMDNLQATMQGYGGPGFLMDSYFNYLRDRELFNNSPVFKTVMSMVSAAGEMTKTASEPGSETEDQEILRGRYEALGKEMPTEDPRSILLDGINALGVNKNAEALAEFFDLLTSEEASLKDLVFAMNGWEKNFMKNITEYKTDDALYKRISGEPIGDIRPESFKKKRREEETEKNEKISEERKSKIPLSSSESGKFNTDRYILSSREKRIKAFKDSYELNKEQIDEFYRKNPTLKRELKEIVGD